jgi:hypothetical protein
MQSYVKTLIEIHRTKVKQLTIILLINKKGEEIHEAAYSFLFLSPYSIVCL